MLAQRRAEERPPNYRTVGGCIMYRFWDIERFAAQTVPGEPATIKGGKIPRCAIYVRSQSLHASDGTSDHIGHCDTFLRQQGWQHFATTVDFGQSNRPWRPLGGFREVLEGALRRDFDVLLVPSAAHISENRLGFRHFVHTLAGFGVEVRMPDAAAANSNLQTKE
jgi:hypothetical protein